MKQQITLLLVLLISAGCISASPACISISGKPVDFFLMRKMPNSTNFLYCDSINGGQCGSPIIPNIAFNDTKQSPLMLTLQQLTPSSVGSSLLGSLVWNNAISPDNEKEDGGHSKGIIGFDEKKGFILQHSSPYFPSVVNNEIQLDLDDDFNFENGNHYFCLSTSTSDLNNLALGYQIDELNIYYGNIPQNIYGVDNLRSLLADSFPNTEDQWKFTYINTLAGVKVVQISKSPSYNTSFYDNILSHYLKSDLLVETGGEPLSPSCKFSGSDYNVVSIKGLYLLMNLVQQQDDNSKYAITSDGNTFCAADLDRSSDQFTRGGSALCISFTNVSTYISSTISDKQSCQRNSFASFVENKLTQQ